MGKIRSAKKTRSHFKAKTTIKREENDISPGKDSAKQPEAESQVPLEQNPFSGLKITLDSLMKQSLQAPEVITTKPVIVSKETKEERDQKSIKKKDRIKQRRDAFIKKLSASQAAMISQKQAKARSKAPVVGDMLQLKKVLQTIDVSKSFNNDLKTKRSGAKVESPAHPKSMAIKSPENASQPERKRQKSMKQRVKQRHAIDEIAKFKERLKTGAFKTDLKSIIAENMRRNL